MKIPLETLTERVSLAVRLVDDFTGAPRPLGEVVVSLQGRGDQPVKNRSGYHVFNDLAVGAVAVQVRSSCYLDEDRNLNLPLPDLLNPLLEIRLKPNWIYPFPLNTTLIRGLALDNGGLPLADAQMRLLPAMASEVANRTTPDGRFVLYVPAPVEDNVQIGAHERVLLTANGTTNFRIRASRDGFQAKSVNIKNILEGQTLLLANPISLKKT